MFEQVEDGSTLAMYRDQGPHILKIQVLDEEYNESLEIVSYNVTFQTSSGMLPNQWPKKEGDSRIELEPTTTVQKPLSDLISLWSIDGFRTAEPYIPPAKQLCLATPQHDS